MSLTLGCTFNPGRVSPGLGYSRSACAIGSKDEGFLKLRFTDEKMARMLATKAVASGELKRESKRLKERAAAEFGVESRQKAAEHHRRLAKERLNASKGEKGKLYGECVREDNLQSLVRSNSRWPRPVQRYGLHYRSGNQTYDSTALASIAAAELQPPRRDQLAKLKQQHDGWRSVLLGAREEQTHKLRVEADKARARAKSVSDANRRTIGEREQQQLEDLETIRLEREVADRDALGFRQEEDEKAKAARWKHKELGALRRVQILQKRLKERRGLEEEGKASAEAVRRAKAELMEEQIQKDRDRLQAARRNVRTKLENQKLLELKRKEAEEECALDMQQMMARHEELRRQEENRLAEAERERAKRQKAPISQSVEAFHRAAALAAADAHGHGRRSSASLSFSSDRPGTAELDAKADREVKAACQKEREKRKREQEKREELRVEVQRALQVQERQRMERLHKEAEEESRMVEKHVQTAKDAAQTQRQRQAMRRAKAEEIQLYQLKQMAVKQLQQRRDIVDSMSKTEHQINAKYLRS